VHLVIVSVWILLPHGNAVKKQTEMEYGILAKLVKVMTVKKIVQKNLNVVQELSVHPVTIVMVECVNPNAKNLLIAQQTDVVSLGVASNVKMNVAMMEIVMANNVV
jgi:hypothetical protein